MQCPCGYHPAIYIYAVCMQMTWGYWKSYWSELYIYYHFHSWIAIPHAPFFHPGIPPHGHEWNWVEGQPGDIRWQKQFLFRSTITLILRPIESDVSNSIISNFTSILQGVSQLASRIHAWVFHFQPEVLVKIFINLYLMARLDFDRHFGL